MNPLKLKNLYMNLYKINKINISLIKETEKQNLIDKIKKK